MQRRFILLAARHLEQLGRIAQPARCRLQLPDDGFERLFFPAEFLRAPAVRPDARILQFLVQRFEPVFFAVEVKDTSATLRRGTRRPAAAWRWR
jgi:hypothetical protein